MSHQIYFHIHESYSTIFSATLKKVLKTIMISILKDHHVIESDITVKITNNEEMLAYNQEFLQHDYYTDILTFPMTQEEGKVEADILISYDMVSYNAEQFLMPFTQELCRVVFHGVLHLCGYDDHTDSDIMLMREKEDYYVKQATHIFVPRETI
jgi:probable rRNA maturation factor